ncbi:MAG: rhodanese-like domain-containing protein [Planctomycetota bacterium]
MRIRPRHSRQNETGASTLDVPHALRSRGTSAIVLAAVAIIGAAGCGERKISDRDLVLIDSTEAMALAGSHQRLLGLAADKTGAWVDPRGEKAFREGHIPEAINLPFKYVTADRRKLEGYDVLIVYGDDYKDPIADAMSKRLMELGFKDVRTLRGGVRAWTDAGHELETAED